MYGRDVEEEEEESWQEAIKWMLGEEGEREEWIGTVEGLRRRMGRGEGRRMNEGEEGNGGPGGLVARRL